MPNRSNWSLLLILMCLSVAGACGPTRSDRPAPAPSLAQRDFATGKEALDLAREKLPGATQLVRMTVTFPRDGGRAEFWSVELLDPARPGQPFRVDIEAKRVVAVQDASVRPEVTPVPFDQIVVDSRDAADASKALGWVTADHEVLLQSTSWLVGDAQSPEAVRGVPTWRLQVTKPSPQGTQIIGFVWVSSGNGSVIAVCRPDQGPCI